MNTIKVELISRIIHEWSTSYIFKKEDIIDFSAEILAGEICLLADNKEDPIGLKFVVCRQDEFNKLQDDIENLVEVLSSIRSISMTYHGGLCGLIGKGCIDKIKQVLEETSIQEKTNKIEATDCAKCAYNFKCSGASWEKKEINCLRYEEEKS